MTGICSKHQNYNAGCRLCNTTPWDLLNCSHEEWEARCQHAEAEGTITCPLCGFTKMYRRTCRQLDNKYLCPCCGRYFEE